LRRALLVAIMVLTARSARAEPTDVALAEALFREGRALMKTGNTAEACLKFRESDRLDPQLGTLVNLALCHEADGKTATAWAEFTELAERAGRAGDATRLEFAREHVAALEKNLSKIRLVVRGAGEQVESLTIKVDGRELGRASWSTSFPLDPGEHTVEASAPGYTPHRQRIVVAAGASAVDVEIPSLAQVPRPATDAPREEAAITTIERPSGVASAAPSVVPIVAAYGVAAVSAGIGTVFGLRTFAAKRDADRECTGLACSPRGLDLDDEARTSAWISTVACSVAIIGIGVGTYLLVRRGARSAATTRTIILGGSW
jgi:hypothetical protein